MYIHHDPDEWEVVTTSRACTSCQGDMRRCNGACNGSASYILKRRDPREIAKIKEQKRREHEDKILIEAELIRRRREKGSIDLEALMRKYDI